MKTTTIVFVLVTNVVNNNYLLVHHTNSNNQKYWDFPSDIVSNNKLPQDTAMQAVLHQTNIQCRVITETKIEILRNNNKFIYYEGEKVFGLTQPNVSEIDEIRWCTKDEALRLLSPELIPPQWK